MSSEHNLPGFGNDPTTSAQFSSLIARLLDYCAAGLEGLTEEQVSDTRRGITNSIGFDIWHVVRTIDNIIFFVFEREQPIWLKGEFDKRWGFPPVDQGTDMDVEEAYALRFPEGSAFLEYIQSVKIAVVPKIREMDDEYFSVIQFVRPWGEVSRMEMIGHGLIGHGNGHLGRVSLARNLYGLEGLAY
mgnify:FL=1|tara:strand:+ start:114 stop:674 length:561 start_codon:yes stop_codon:yes gene_type:complete